MNNFELAKREKYDKRTKNTAAQHTSLMAIKFSIKLGYADFGRLVNLSPVGIFSY